jgi:succinate dehydrogenase/fumarate reductase flavoprotein subunit
MTRQARMGSLETDVLVVGGGGAGAMACYEGSKHGVRVTMALKGLPQRSGSTVLAPGAIAGVGEWHVPGDSPALHLRDTVVGGSFMNEQRLVRAMVEASPDLIVELETLGAMWEREPDEETYSLRIDGGHSFHRCPYLGDHTGREILRALYGQLARRRVKILSRTMILKVLTDSDGAVGAIGIDLRSCEPVLVRAKSVILACGGAGNVYLNTTNPAGVTGDGYALALDAGAVLIDMEFVQFFPLGFVFPPSLRGALGGQLYFARLRNSLGERFMEKYDPERMEYSTRDRIALACITEIREGRGGPHGGIFADVTHYEPGCFAREQPTFYETYRKIGIDPEREYVEVAPTCHHFMGGALVDEDWETTVPGLFAAGESAGGIHGANRLSQNALADLLVSGRQAGRAAARRALDAPHARIDPRSTLGVVEPVGRLLRSDEGVRPRILRDRLRTIMWENAGVVRAGSGLSSLDGELAELEAELGQQTLCQRSMRLNQELVEGLENYCLLRVAQCVVQAALSRTESRGAHYRSDFPATNSREGLTHVAVRLRDGNLCIERVPVDLCEITPTN